ncbi:MAG: FIST N-terminal domain-containing protein [Cyanobacteria bacterium P01_D01_bin.128]
MQWTSALSTRASLETAIDDVVEQTQQALAASPGASPDVGFVFISSAFASEFPRLLPLLREKLSVPTLIGCSGGGVVGWQDGASPVEVEDRPALSLAVACLPDVQLQTFHLSAEDLPDLDSPPDAWISLTGISPESQPQFVLMADPYSPGINDVLQGLDFAYPSAVKVGGLAGVGSVNKSSGLFCDDQLYTDGVVGLALSGNIVLDAIVAQGCRPIGQPYQVVEAEQNVILKLDDGDDRGDSSIRPPIEVLQALFQTLSEADRKLAQSSLFIGVEQSSFSLEQSQGDFLIRNLIGVDPRLGAIAIGDRIRPGQRVQFHLRDASTSAEDLESLLRRYPIADLSTRPAEAGALMFSCMGRGQGLYKAPSFDARLFDRYVKQVPLSGFFCNGEIGPIGNSTFLHGYTSVFAICHQPS